MTEDNFVSIFGGQVQGFIQENHGTVHQNIINQISDSLSGQTSGTEKPLTGKELRQREVLLSKVKQGWIEGVLERSLHTQAMIELSLEKRSNAVDPPFRGFEEPPEDPKLLPTGTTATKVFTQIGEGRTLLILGEPGAGKTITLLKLAENLVARATEDVSLLIPVVFNLSSWGKQPTIADWLVQELWSKYQVPKEVGKNWVKKQQLLLLLDGLDEVKADRREDCVQAVNKFMQDHGQTEMVVCSRIVDYEVLSKRLQLRGAICIRSLTTEQVNQYLDAAGEQLRAVKTLLTEDTVLQELAKSPLTLSVMTLAYQGKKVEEILQTGSIEERREHLFNSYIERMFKRKGAKHQYPQDQAIHWLTCLAKRMSQSDFQIEEIQPRWLPSKKDKIIYRIVTGLILGVLLGLVSGIYFVYFYTLVPNNKVIPPINILIKLIAIGVLSGLIPGLIIGLLSLSLRFNRLKKGLMSGIIFAISIYFFSYFIYHKHIDIPPILLSAILGGAIFSSIDRKIKPVESIELDNTKLFKYAIIFGIFGMLYALIKSRLYLNFYSVYEIIIFILVGVFLGGFRIRKNSINPKQAKPNEGIKRSLRYTVITFCSLVFAAIFVGLVMDFSFQWNPVLICLGLAMGLLGGLGANESSGVVCIQHYTLRLMLYRKNYIPLDYVSFLNYASDRIFLQKVGGGYIFVHRMLQEHFARMG
ncbi:NACHT domain-containing protein [Nostoc favosum]|uniref:NACHT domain-containing protein n=1 Tax=Nostoc favosum CHAB5714 TaxID=2780399 RepID=A0ABS8IL21_9NOSO|nr:NACHT domain-containing protein [Nostoc favosum]MCC5604988.1 NACHT domain-containing protein [Nostoc favosum CHAB5714]